MKDAAYWIEKLQLQAHPEGGYFAESFRSEESLTEGLPDRYSGPRALSTSIYFLIPPGQFSSLHRLQTDEIWHYHQGGPLELVFLNASGIWSTKLLGPDPDQGQQLQQLAPRGHWFGARPIGSEFSLAGCTMAPGFEFADFELARRSELLDEFPELSAEIRAFTHAAT